MFESKRYYILFVSTNMAHLPVLIDGKKVATTNSLGDAYVRFIASASDKIAVTIITEKNILPKNPEKQYKIARKNIYIFKQDFKIKNEKAKNK
jgi:hypothetical protein